MNKIILLALAACFVFTVGEASVKMSADGTTYTVDKHGSVKKPKTQVPNKTKPKK